MRFLGKDIILVAGRSDYSPSLCIDMTLKYCTCRRPPTDTDTDTDLSTLLSHWTTFLQRQPWIPHHQRPNLWKWDLKWRATTCKSADWFIWRCLAPLIQNDFVEHCCYYKMNVFSLCVCQIWSDFWSILANKPKYALKKKTNLDIWNSLGVFLSEHSFFCRILGNVFGPRSQPASLHHLTILFFFFLSF